MAFIYTKGYFPAFLIILALAAACRPPIKKTPSGLEYTIYHTGLSGGPVAGSGSTVKMEYTLKHDDTIINSTSGVMPLYQPLIPGLIFPYSPMEVLGYGVRAGDSILVWQKVDSMLKNGKMEKLPPGWQTTDQVTTVIKVLKVFPFDYRAGDSLVQADKLQEAQLALSKQAAEQPGRMRQYLNKHHITAEAMPSGVFVETLTRGHGPAPDSGQTISIRYTCSTLGGRVLDSNRDTSFHHDPLLTYTTGSGMLPPFIERTLAKVNRGSHIKMYIPGICTVDTAEAARLGRIPTEAYLWDVELLDMTYKSPGVSSH